MGIYARDVFCVFDDIGFGDQEYRAVEEKLENYIRSGRVGSAFGAFGMRIEFFVVCLAGK